MPVIARFYGMILKMYFRQKEHNPPHIHVSYGECNGIYELINGDMYEGDMPIREQQMVRRFIKYYKDKLLEMWENQEFEVLPPIE